MKYMHFAILMICLPCWLQPAWAGPVLCIHNGRTHLHSYAAYHDCHHTTHAENRDDHQHTIQFQRVPCCKDIPLEQDILTDKIKIRTYSSLVALLRAEVIGLTIPSTERPLNSFSSHHFHTSDRLRSVILLI